MDRSPRTAPSSAPPGGPDATAAIALSMEHLTRLQRDGGAWVGEVKWCTALVSQYVIVHHLIGRSVPEERRERILLQYRSNVTREGGFSLSPGEAPYVFTTALAYVAMRLLGVPPDDPLARRAREWLRAQPGGVLSIPSWGKLWLALAGLYGWEGVNPVPPEIWLLPESAPLHPRRLYNHTRLIYLGMGYLYARRFTGPITPLVDRLRDELYGQPWGSIAFGAHRHTVASSDLFDPPGALLRAAYDALHAYERVASPALRRRALDRCFELVLFELRTTNHVSISPVNGLLNVLVTWERGHPEFEQALSGVEYWSWEDEAEGLRYCGAHSHTWDTAFVIRAAVDAPPALAEAMSPALSRGYRFLRDTQLRDEIPDRERWYRDRVRGGWCFSDDVHRWPVSDCTAEALSAVLAMEPRIDPRDRVSEAMLLEAAAFILSRRNDDGGFGSFERARGAKLLESINPSEMFGSCMVERSYTECTASCVHALARFRRRFPSVMRPEVDRAIDGGVALIVSRQDSEGGWASVWGVNYTYGIMLCVEALCEAGVAGTAPAMDRAARWLLARQKGDGGWGEDPASCRRGMYMEHRDSQVIQTAWALMALLRMEHPGWAAIERGARLLMTRQLPDGDFPEEAPTGVFFHAALLHYRMYKSYFTTWALGRYESARRSRMTLSSAGVTG